MLTDRIEGSLDRRKKLINNATILQYQIETIVRCILPDILAFYENEEGQRGFVEWQAQLTYDIVREAPRIKTK